mgnify:CR=1 FL=1
MKKNHYANKQNTGPLFNFKKMVKNDIYKHLINSKSYKIVESGYIDSMNYYAIVKLRSSYDNKIHYYKFTLSRQYDFKNNKALYDNYSGLFLEYSWRTDSVLKINRIKDNQSIKNKKKSRKKKKKLIEQYWRIINFKGVKKGFN